MSELNPDHRRELILQRVRAAGSVRVAELVAELGVSDMTVRRDLDQLAEIGEIDKVHGGARLPPGSSAVEPGFARKSMLHSAAKGEIARLAAALVTPGMSIGLNSGTTTHALAQILRMIPEITVVTNSPLISQVFDDASARRQTVLLTGGIRTPSDALVGPVATSALRTLVLDQCFIGVHGMSTKAGLTTPNMLESEVNALFMEISERTTVLADSSKWGLAGLHRFAGLADADELITDPGLPPEALSALSSDHPELEIIVGAHRQKESVTSS